MSFHSRELSFGDEIGLARRRLQLEYKEIVSRLGRKCSPSYLTRIEVRGEIPNPEMVIRLALVLGLDTKMMLEKAKKEKLESYKKILERRYKDES